MKKSTMLAGVFAVAVTGAAQAGEPVQLSAAEMDGVTAGALLTTILSNGAAQLIQQVIAVNALGTATVNQTGATSTTTNSAGASASASGGIQASATALIQTAKSLSVLAQYSFVQIN